MKLTTTTFVSLDGVMQGISGRDEDRSGGFERGGWTTPLWDNEAATFLNEVYGRADAFLFGRRTYEIFAGSWGVVDDPSINPIAKALNTRPKYVASTTLTDPRKDTTVLSGDVAAAVGEHQTLEAALEAWREDVKRARRVGREKTAARVEEKIRKLEGAIKREAR
jgi:dihydrofolate reductase